MLLLLILPFWINYLMRMLAWINLLGPDGLGTRFLRTIGIERLFLSANLLSDEGGWLAGQPFTVILALTYGYLPFLILPLYASLDRIDQRQIEAARDLGASPASAFRRVTLPLSRPGILAGLVLISLPMFGDYYTQDLVSQSTKTSMIGNQIDLLTRQGSQKVAGACLTLVLAVLLLGLMIYYLRATRSATIGAEALMARGCATPGASRASSSSSRARYILWSLIPVAIAVLFAFNDGRSRTTWQGFSTRWFTAPTGSVFHDPALQGALKHTLFLGVMCVLVATPIGVALALGLQRWRGPGRRHGQHAHAAPARDPRDRDGRRAAAALPPGASRHRPRLERADHRSGDVHDLVRRRDRARPARLDREGLRGGGGRPRGAAARPAHSAFCCRCSPRRSSRARRSSSRSRSTTSSSRSTSPATRARRRCRCCSTRPVARRRHRR